MTSTSLTPLLKQQEGLALLGRRCTRCPVLPIHAAARGGLVFILFTFGPANLVLRASRSDCTPPIRTTFFFEAVQNPGLTMRSLPKSNRQRRSVYCHRAPMRLAGSTQ